MRYFKRIDAHGNTTTVESYSHDKKVKGAIAINKTEYDAFIASLPIVEPVPRRNLVAEIDEIKAKIADYDEVKARIDKLEKK